MKTLRLILGDQLNNKHTWFKTTTDDVIYCMFEMRQETDYVVHHIQKVIGFFSAMRQFGDDLKNQNHQLTYFKINDKRNTQDLVNNLQNLIKEYDIDCFEYQEPDEYRLDQQLKDFCSTLSIHSKVYSTEHFYTQREDLAAFFEGKKHYLMESFYREMRKKHDILMVAGQPEGGKWNYDQSNRNKWKGEHKIPPYKVFNNHVDDVVSNIQYAKIKTMGTFESKTFPYPITRKQALEQLKYFCEALLIHFGDYQDAMHTDEINLFHSGFINCKRMH